MAQINTELQKNKKDGKEHSTKDRWVEAYELMQDIIEQTPLEKKLKWGMDVYTFNNKNVVAWSGFKDFFSVWFYHGVFLKDSLNVLVNASEGKTKALRQWRFTDVKDMNPTQILHYIKESIQCVKNGQVLTPSKLPEPKPEGLLADALHANKDLSKAFQKLTKSKQREYCNYILEAKEIATKERRLNQIIPMILVGKGLNDKYK